MDSNGTKEKLLIEYIGSYQGSDIHVIDSPGIYLLNVQADGDWTVQISR